MAATVIGTTVGNFGIGADETGILISSIDWDYVADEKEVRDRQGCATGVSIYNERAEISVSGLVSSVGAPNDAVGDSITLTNAIDYDMLQATVGGTTVLKSVKRGRSSEDFETIELSATFYPLVV